MDDGLRDRDREGDNFTEGVVVEDPEPVRSSDFNEMLATGLVPMSIGRKGFRRDVELLRYIGEHRSGRDFARFQRTARPSHSEQEHRSEEHTSELQSLMRISYAVFCLKKKKNKKTNTQTHRLTQSKSKNTRTN